MSVNEGAIGLQEHVILGRRVGCAQHEAAGWNFWVRTLGQAPCEGLSLMRFIQHFGRNAARCKHGAALSTCTHF